jgi:Uma2 family endonuclease
MVSTLPIPKALTPDESTNPSIAPLRDQWVKASWEEFLAASENSEETKERCYYDSGWMRIETMSIGSGHAQDNGLLALVFSVYGGYRDIEYVTFVSPSFRKAGERECQPDLAYFIDPKVQRPPKNSQAIDVETWGPPTLAIEISSTTLSDDLGKKRLLYERLGVQEYWVVNVKEAVVIAFEVANGGSREIRDSGVLPGLAIGLVEEVLRLSQTESDGYINRWLIQQFRSS